jgi:outer membrane protein TolC
VPIPDPIVRAILRDVQTTQDLHSASLAALTQSAESQQADMRKISRQLNTLTAQVSALHGAVGPLTTGSIAPTNSRARLLRPSRKTALAPPEISPVAATPALPKPAGPVSVGGAPLGSGA